MNKLFLYLLIFCMFACDNTMGPPKGILSERKMVDIMVDLLVAESQVKTLRVSSDSVRHLFNIYEVKIFDKHNVTSEKYLRSYEYYLENHRLMSRVHDATLDTLLNRQQKVEAMPIPEPVKEPDPEALRLESLRLDSLRLDSLRRDSLSRDSVERFRLRRDSIRRTEKKSLKLQNRKKPVLRKKETQ